MSDRELTRARLRKIPIGSMRNPVIVHGTSITTPSVGVDFGRSIEPLINPWMTKITTLTGVTIFDSSNIETVVTHEFVGRYSPLITEKMFIEHNDKYYRVISVQDYEDRHEYSVLLCTERGPIVDAVNKI